MRDKERIAMAKELMCRAVKHRDYAIEVSDRNDPCSDKSRLYGHIAKVNEERIFAIGIIFPELKVKRRIK